MAVVHGDGWAESAPLSLVSCVSIPNAAPGPQCEFYNPNGICRLYGSIGYDYIYTDTAVKTEEQYEGDIGRVKRFFEDRDPECASLILDMLCHYYFPACDFSQPHPQPVQVMHMHSHTQLVAVAYDGAKRF